MLLPELAQRKGPNQAKFHFILTSVELETSAGGNVWGTHLTRRWVQPPEACLRRDPCCPVAHQQRPPIITGIVKQGLDCGDHVAFRGKSGAMCRCRRVTVSGKLMLLCGLDGVWARRASCQRRDCQHWKIGRG